MTFYVRMEPFSMSYVRYIMPAPTTDIPEDDRPDPNDPEDFELPDQNALLEGICTSVWQQCVQQHSCKNKLFKSGTKCHTSSILQNYD